MGCAVKHLESGTSFERQRVLFNEKQKSRSWKQGVDPAIEEFHKTLPQYAETPLHSLPAVASELGFSHVFVKDESTRFGLPSFKILGASWTIHQTICQRLRLPTSTSLADLKHALKDSSGLRLVTCTEGNWGRACARMAKYLDVPVTIYVPYFMNDYTQDLLREEGAEVKVLANGSYDDTIAVVQHDAKSTGAVMVLDTSWPGFTQIPQWVTDGYSTMLAETDRQVAAATDGKFAGIAFVSVGVGSWAHAVVEHYKTKNAANRIVTVEPDAAPSFKESLHCGDITPISTGETIMNGMNCGTSSTIAWPILRDGSYAAITVSDVQSHECVQYLLSQGINAGPCGAATLAALRTLCSKIELPERNNTIVVLFSTEGMRKYDVPS